MSYTDDRIFLIECMVRSGYTKNSAREWLNRFVDRANTRALEESDHTAYRDLADEVEKIIHAESEPDDWDGDDSELYILTVFLEWLPDMIRHADAEKIREQADRHAEGHAGMHEAADLVDPFRKDADEYGDPMWIRKRDGAQVPERVAQLG